MKIWIHASQDVMCFEDIPDSPYSIGQESDGNWYVYYSDSLEVVDGPYATQLEAQNSIETNADKAKHDQIAHQKYLDQFNDYSRRLQGRFFIDDKTCCQNRRLLERFVTGFNNANPDANLRIDSDYTDGVIYYFVY